MAQASPVSVGDTPFVLSPVGIDYLGWLTPKQCRLNKRCDVAVVDPRTGKLYLEQSDDLVGTRVFSDRTWELSHRVEYELQESLVQTVQDFWTVSISYEYEGRNLVQVDWSDGRRIEIEYDRRDRVVVMSDTNQHRLEFVWGRDGHHRMVDSSGKVLNWVVSDSSVTVTDSLGMTSTMTYDENGLTGWIDPRGLQTRIDSTPTGLEVEQAGLRTWRLNHADGMLTELELIGSGTWKWQYDGQGRLTQITDPSMNKLTLLRENERSVRILRHNGFVDFAYSATGYLTEVSDISGRLIGIERDVYGQIVRIEDAVGETFSLDRDTAGLLKRLTLRDGREWVIERDADGHIRNIVFPNQEVWGFTRDKWGAVTALDRSHDNNFNFVLHDGVWSSISLPNGEQWTIRRDGYSRVTEIVAPAGRIWFERDVLGQVTSITVEKQTLPVEDLAQTQTLEPFNQESSSVNGSEPIGVPNEIEEISSQTWTLERDVFGNIQRWGDIDLEIGAWDTIRSHSQGEEVWNWFRDSTGRLTAVEAGETRIDITYDGSGDPVRWTKEDDVSTIKRNHWGWVTNIDEQWLQHDPRGLVEKSGIYDLTWRWNRNASGFPLVVKGPYQLQVGFEISPTNGIQRIRFPNGEMQTFRLQNTGIAQWHTNVQAQEESLPTSPRTEWVSKVLTATVLSDDYLTHNVGIHTIEYAQDVQTIEYDPFHFVKRICDLASCFDLSYDPRGHLIEIEDGTGLPTSIVWGWNGWAEAPVLIGGTIGFHTPRGMIVQSAGTQESTALFWNHTDHVSTRDTEQPFVDAATYHRGVFSWMDNPVTVQGQHAYLDGIPRSLQHDKPWMSQGIESKLFAYSIERSIWNQPLNILQELSIVQLPAWVNFSVGSPLNWVSKDWLSSNQTWATEVNGLPIAEGPVETWLLLSMLSGQGDPSNNEVLFRLIDDPNMQSILTGDYPFHSTKCIPEFAQFYSCG